MPKPSFTAGPWRLYRPEGFAILSEDAIIGVAHHGKERAAIDTRVISEDEANANARLIAAAPELLDGLKAAEELLAFHEGSANPATEGGQPVIWVNGEDWQNLLDSTRQLIARAEGGQS
jgi:hypothetical protein